MMFTNCPVSGDSACHSRERSDLGIAYLCQDFSNAMSADAGFCNRQIEFKFYCWVLGLYT
jgi:hypothetical protein